MATAAKKTSAKSKADAKGQGGLVAPKPADFTKDQELAADRDMSRRRGCFGRGLLVWKGAKGGIGANVGHRRAGLSGNA